MTQITGRLEGKVAIITGASRGIGAATARLFAQEGAIVVLAARNEDALNALAAEISSSGGTALAVPTDIGDAAAVERLVKTTVDRFGRLDAAFNNAGDGHRPAPLADIPLDQFERAIRITIVGTFLCLKFQIPAMLASGGGSIVNMSSTAGIGGVRGMGGYVAAKHAIVGLSKSAALDYADRNLRVNVVAPGPILTERLAALTDEQRKPMEAAVPMHRAGLPQEVASTVAWLCSAESAYITGAVIPVDGGRTASSSGAG